jgi:N-acetylmuramoyl-L-alanine amidase
LKIGLVVGHNAKSKGAVSKWLNTNEFDFYSEVARLVKKKLNVEIFTREYMNSYSKEMTKVVEQVNKGKFDLVIELHFNSFNGEASGCECLHWHTSRKGKVYSDKFNLLMKSKGVETRKNILVKDLSINGAYGVMKSNCPYILVEPFFADNKKDTDIVKSAENMANIIVEYIKYL